MNFFFDSAPLVERNNEYYHTVVIASGNLSNPEANPRCYDKFVDDNNRVVNFLIKPSCDQFTIEHKIFLDSTFDTFPGATNNYLEINIS